MKFALNVISGAGFGVPFNWDSSSNDISENHTLSFKDAITSVLHHLLGIVLVPRKLWKLPIRYLRESEEGYEEFGKYMKELLEREKKILEKEGSSDGSNLLAALVKHAASEDEGKGIMTDDEIIGNTFIFLIAGHETTYSLINEIN
jgi:cytochrome P450